MESKETKIARLLRTPSVFNWGRQNRPRYDDTLRLVRLLIERPPQRTLRAVHGLCNSLANRKISFEEAMEKASTYQGFLRTAADEILPALDNYLTERQVEVVEGYVDRPQSYPFARNPDDTVRAIPITPAYASVENDRLVANYILGWATVPLSYYQVTLICSVIADGILSLQDFRGSDARVILLRRGKWKGVRQVETWKVSDYALLNRRQLTDQFDRYNRVLDYLISEIEADRL